MSLAGAWDLLGAFLAVMREGSLSAAARSLGQAQPTVRRHIEALEAKLALVLFTRAPTGLIATEAAHRLLPHAEAMEASAAALFRDASGGDGLTGTVRVTCSEVMACEVVPGLLAPLLAQRPELEIELVASNATQDLLRRDADVAVRMAPPSQAALVARKIGAITLGLYAAPAYLAARGAPQSPDELAAGHALVGDDRRSALAAALRAAGLAPDTLRWTLRTDSDVAQLAAIRAGLGIGVCQEPLALRHGLTRVLPQVGAALDTWVAMHEDLRASPRVRAVFDHLAKAVARYAAGGR